MDLTNIAAALSLAATASEADILAAIGAQTEASKALASRLTSIGAAAGVTGDVGDDAVIAIAAKLKAVPAAATSDLQTVIDGLQKEVASLRKGYLDDKAAVAVDDAIKAGKLTPAQRGWAIDYASREPDAFATFIGAQPAILGDGRVAPAAPQAGELTAQQKALCASTGVSEEAFKKALAVKDAA